MDGGATHPDDALLRALAERANALDRVPEGVRAAARDALVRQPLLARPPAWRRLLAAVAGLSRRG